MRLLTTDEVARRLGVKRETVYAYVSRGLLTRHPASERHGSRFEHEAVERLAAGARRPGRSAALEVVVDTELTALDPGGRLFYRGQDAVALARFRTFEQVAGLLWDGDPCAPWELDPPDVPVVASLRAVTPAAPAPALIPLLIAGLAATAEQPGDRRPAAVRRAGARMLAGLLDGLSDPEPASDRSAAARLWPALTQPPRASTPAQRATLNAALVLLADHELAASTLAARVAASAWADPYRVALAGLGPMGGTLHGAASLAVDAMLEEITDPDAAFGVVEQRLATGGGHVAGFGHRVYLDRDPRAQHLLDRIAASAVDPGRAQIVTALVDAGAALGLPAPNVDLALAGITYTLRLRPGSAMVIFTFARLVGLLAHALEEYPHRLRFRPRARYVGPVPGP
jgi:citrate synthase